MKPDWLIQEETRNILVDFRRSRVEYVSSERQMDELQKAQYWNSTGRPTSRKIFLDGKSPYGLNVNKFVIPEPELPIQPILKLDPKVYGYCGNHDLRGLPSWARFKKIASCELCRAVKAGLDVSLISQVVGKV